MGVVEESFPVVLVVETVLVVDAKEAVLLGPLFVFWPKNVPYAICATTKTATTSSRRRTTAKMRVLFRGRRGSPELHATWAPGQTTRSDSGPGESTALHQSWGLEARPHSRM